MSDSEYEEEEILVFADFKNQLMPDELDDPHTMLKLIGLDTQNPIAEINGNVFKGNYDYAMGTNVFFEEDKDAPPSDPLFEPSCRKNYKYFAKTTKVINFQRMFVEPNEDDDKKEQETEEEGSEEAPSTSAAARMELENSAAADDVNVKPSLTYEEAIKLLPSASELQ